MERDHLPAVITRGGTALQHDTPGLARELDSGAIVHLVQIQTGRHRGWFAAEAPPGSDPVRVTVWALHRTVGRVLDDVRGGEVFEVVNVKEGRTLGFLFWCAPEWLARQGVSLQYSGRAGPAPGCTATSAR